VADNAKAGYGAEFWNRIPQSAYGEFWNTLPKRKEPTLPPWTSGFGDEDVANGSSLLPGLEQMQSLHDQDLGSISKESDASGRTGADKESYQNPVFIDPERKRMDAYIRALESMPKRGDYKPSLISKIGSTLTAMSLGGQGRGAEALKVQRETLDRPYETAYSEWAGKLKGNKEAADIENDFNRTRDYTQRTALQEQRDRARDEQNSRLNERQMSEIERRSEHDRAVEDRLWAVENRKVGETKFKQEHPKAARAFVNPLSKIASQTDMNSALVAAAHDVVATNPNWNEYLYTAPNNQVVIRDADPSWDPAKLADFNRFRTLAQQGAVKRLTTTRGELRNNSANRYSFER
jgi:hypothetical protein